MKRTDYNTNISEINKKFDDLNHEKYIITPEFDVLAAMVFNARLAQADLVTKTDTRLQILNKKINSNKTKHLPVETELKKTRKI